MIILVRLCAVFDSVLFQNCMQYSSIQEPGSICRRKLLDRQLEQILTMINDIHHSPLAEAGSADPRAVEILTHVT